MENKRKISVTPLSVVLLCVLIVYACSLFFSLFWAFLTSFKDVFEFDVNVIGLPEKWVFNHATAFRNFVIEVETALSSRTVHMAEMYLNSVLYALGCAVAATITPCIVGYLCAKFRYKFSAFINVLVVVVMVIPVVGSQPAEIQMARMLGIYDTVWGMWIMKTNFLSMYYLMFYATFSSLPDGYTEAAKIDGAGNVQVLFRIILPLVKSTLFTIGLINFINFWNDYSIPMIYIPSHPTIAQGMWTFSLSAENELSSVPMKMAGATLMLLPVLVLFLVFHKRLLNNLNVGGLKG